EEAHVDSRLATVGHEAGSPGINVDESTNDASAPGDAVLTSTAYGPDGAPFDAGHQHHQGGAAVEVEADGAADESPDDTTHGGAANASEDDTGEGTSTVPDMAETLCDKYCEEITELCTGELAQYRDKRQCQTVCAMFPEGDIASEVNENTVSCRLRYASKSRYAAGVELAAYCRQAGPGGDGRCGSNCEGYCTLMKGVCTPEEAGIYRFEDDASCMQACESLPSSSVPYSTSGGEELSDGDHVQCRLFHVTS